MHAFTPGLSDGRARAKMEAVHRCCTAPALVFVAALGAAYVGEQQRTAPTANECTEPAPRSPTPPPVLTLRTREHEVAIYGGGELGFTVLDHAGFVLAERIDEDAFAERFPALHQQLETAFATEGGWLDASAARQAATAPSQPRGSAAVAP